MDLRAKLATIFLALLAVPFVAVSAVEINRTMSLMVNDLADSGTLIADQAFEQIRSALSRSQGDPIAALRSDAALQAFLNSSQAFGKGVVYARIDALDGTPIVAGPAPYTLPHAATIPPFGALTDAMSSWWLPTRLAALWGQHTYEISRVVSADGRPLMTIRIGLSTALIAAQARRSVEDVLGVSAAGVALSLVCAMLAGTLLLRPIEAIITGVDQIAAGREEVHLPIAGHDELRTLTEKFNDLSRRIRANRTQWETERGQLFNIFRTISDGVLLLDTGGAVMFANAEAQSRLGLAANPEGKMLGLLIGRENPLARMIETVYATGNEVRDVALDMDHSDEPKRMLVSISTLGQGPEPPGLLVMLRDLESVRELESVMDYSGRLVRLGGLISGVAHQLRNPLNAMNLQLELLAQDAARGAPVEQRLLAVRKEIERLDRAVDALMRFMRPESLKLARVAINDLLSEIAGEIVPPAVTVEFRLDPATPIVNADRAMLAEALRNIINNGAEAMPGGGLLAVATAVSRSGFIEITIRDRGCGISPENREHIFNLYFTTKRRGSGLGLPIALRAIDLHHGTLEVNSEEGLGTTVTIRLPTFEPHDGEHLQA